MSEEIILIEEDDKGWFNPTPARWESFLGMVGGNGATGGDFILTKTSIIFKPRRARLGSLPSSGEETVIPTNKIEKVNSIKVRRRATLEVGYYDGDDNSFGEYKKAHFIVRNIENWITEIKRISEEMKTVHQKLTEKKMAERRRADEEEAKRKKKEDLENAEKHEKLLEFEEAAKIYKQYEMDNEVVRVRKLKAEQGAVKVNQKVVHGDEITKTEIKDSVVSKSSIGAGGDDKFARLEKLTEMKEKGLIDDDEFQQMKKEILGK